MEFKVQRDRPGLVVWFHVAGLVCLTLWCASAGTWSLPPDEHEVLVLQTVKEMHQRGNWIVPYFNGEPRLNKPPLSYWLTAASARLFGGIDDLQPWHGRLPSVIGGTILMLCTFWIGLRMFDRDTGMLAALLLISSLAFFSFTRDARPDMVYAALTALLLTAFVAACESQTSGRRYLNVALMWLFAGAAILSKGPHMPALVLLACVLAYRHVGPSGIGVLRFMQPIPGLGLAALGSAWWWLALRGAIGPESLADSQLSGSLLMLAPEKILDPYYLYRTFELVLPWVYLLPAVIMALLVRGSWTGPIILAVLVVCVCMLGLTLGVQKRPLYMLPAVVPLFLLMARCALQCWADERVSRAVWRRAWLPFHLLCVLLGAVFVSGWGTASGSAKLDATVLIGAAAGLLTLTAFAQSGRRSAQPMLLTAVVAAVGCGFLGFSRSPWSEDRYAKAELASVVKTAVGEQTPVLSFKVDPSVYVYYIARPIPKFDDWAKLETAIAALRRAPYVLVPEPELPRFARSYDIRVLGDKPGMGKDHTLVILVSKRDG